MYKILVGKPEGKRPLRRLRCKQDCNIKIYLKETVWKCMEWIDLTSLQGMVGGSCKHSNESSIP
jgi:hypothetical protein